MLSVSNAAFSTALRPALALIAKVIRLRKSLISLKI